MVIGEFRPKTVLLAASPLGSIAVAE